VCDFGRCMLSIRPGTWLGLCTRMGHARSRCCLLWEHGMAAADCFLFVFGLAVTALGMAPILRIEGWPTLPGARPPGPLAR